MPYFWLCYKYPVIISNISFIYIITVSQSQSNKPVRWFVGPKFGPLSSLPMFPPLDPFPELSMLPLEGPPLELPLPVLSGSLLFESLLSESSLSGSSLFKSSLLESFTWGIFWRKRSIYILKYFCFKITYK